MRHARQELRRLSGLVTSFLDAWDLHLYVVKTFGNARSSLRSPLFLSLSEINGPRQASRVDRNLDVSLRRRNRHPVLAAGLTRLGRRVSPRGHLAGAIHAASRSGCGRQSAGAAEKNGPA
jgi:hypothetical protein